MSAGVGALPSCVGIQQDQQQSWGSVSRLPRLLLLPLRNPSKHKRSLDVQSVPLCLLVFIVWLVIVIVLHVAVVGGGVDGGRGGGWHRVGSGVPETLRLEAQPSIDQLM